MLSLIDSYISVLNLIKVIIQRVSKWGSLSFPMKLQTLDACRWDKATFSPWDPLGRPMNVMLHHDVRARAPFIAKDRDPLIRGPLFLSLWSLIKATSSLIDYHIIWSSLIKAICQRVSKWGSLSFPMNIVEHYIHSFLFGIHSSVCSFLISI